MLNPDARIARKEQDQPSPSAKKIYYILKRLWKFASGNPAMQTWIDESLVLIDRSGILAKTADSATTPALTGKLSELEIQNHL